MPKRIVDGEGVWGSDKLLKLQKEYRPEYANLVPLAEANGVFEADPYKVWSRVYSYNRREVTVEWVAGLLQDLVRVGMLFLWEDKGKVWGFWEGNQKAGRLPSPSEQIKYKNLPLRPPTHLLSGSSETSMNLLPRLGMVGIVKDGSVLEPAAQENKESFENEESDMKLKDELTKIAAQHGAKAGGYKTTWDEIKTLGVAYGTGAVATDFTAYMEEYRGDDFPSGAVVSYLRSASDRLTTPTAPAAVVSKDPRVVGLVRELTYLSGDKVTFYGKQKVELSALLERYPEEELISVFKTFVSDKDMEDSYTLRHLAQNYIDAADGLAYSARKRKQEAEQAKIARDAKARELQETAEAERQEAAKKQKEEEFDPFGESE